MVLNENSEFLDLHIPHGGKMNIKVCLDSFQKAFSFFATCFPESNPVAITCKSWIFNTQFEELMPESNLAQLMREVYLYPVKSTGRDGMVFIFGKPDYSDLARAPRNTSLQRAFLQILEAGKNLRCGGMFLLKEDLRHFGKQFYRNHENVI